MAAPTNPQVDDSFPLRRKSGKKQKNEKMEM